MTNNHDQINHLLDKMNVLLKRQDEFQKEIGLLRDEIIRLKSDDENLSQSSTVDAKDEPEITHTVKQEPSVLFKKSDNTFQGSEPHEASSNTREKLFQTKSDLEAFIGENLANKIGIIITVIGVAIGVKFAIDHELISPLVRIILGYLGGIILLGFAISLRKNYENFSSVLLSGSLAIMYFITYAAYDFYELIPKGLSYSLMVFFTVFSVIAAISYNRQVIAHIGLVGSYAIPFMLGVGYGNFIFLFSYIAIINAGILAIAFKKNWKPLYISAFIITWLVYLVWFILDFKIDRHFGVSFAFQSIYFVIFYLIFLSYKILKSENFDASDVVVLLINSFVYFGLGYRILELHSTGKNLLGLFAVINAVIHFIVCVIIYRNKLADKNLFYLVAGLVLVFITIAIPIQLNGRWVTLLWAGEALLLFRIGRNNNIRFYENISYPVMLLSFISIIHDWSVVYKGYYTPENELKLIPLLNINFLSSLLFVSSFAMISYLNFSEKFAVESSGKTNLRKVFNVVIPSILIVSAYFTFRLEIAAYWDRLYSGLLNLTGEGKFSGSDGSFLYKDLRNFKAIWLLNYSLFFVSVLSLFNILKLKSRKLSSVSIALNCFFLLLFLTHGLYILSELRDSYLSDRIAEDFGRGNFHLLIRYVTYVFAAFTVYFSALYMKDEFIKPKFKIAFELLLHLLVLWVVSSELITWMDILNSDQSYKFGLSILWGIYALGLVTLGIWKRKKYLRVGAIILFGSTLLKLFFYDVSHLRTLPKTIIFISLGILLLIISFMYNKYKHIIFNELHKDTSKNSASPLSL